MNLIKYNALVSHSHPSQELTISWKHYKTPSDHPHRTRLLTGNKSSQKTTHKTPNSYLHKQNLHTEARQVCHQAIATPLCRLDSPPESLFLCHSSSYPMYISHKHSLKDFSRKLASKTKYISIQL